MANKISDDKKQIGLVLPIEMIKKLDARAALEGTSRTAVISAAVDAYLGKSDASTDSAKLDALIDQLAVKDAQLAKKDEQIAKLMETVADSTKAVQGAQVLHHETAQALALESTEQKLSRWQRLKRAWRG